MSFYASVLSFCCVRGDTATSHKRSSNLKRLRVSNSFFRLNFFFSCKNFSRIGKFIWWFVFVLLFFAWCCFAVEVFSFTFTFNFWTFGNNSKNGGKLRKHYFDGIVYLFIIIVTFLVSDFMVSGVFPPTAKKNSDFRV